MYIFYFILYLAQWRLQTKKIKINEKHRYYMAHNVSNKYNNNTKKPSGVSSVIIIRRRFFGFSTTWLADDSIRYFRSLVTFDCA